MGIRTQITAPIAALASILPQIVGATCADDRLSIQGDWGQASFAIEVADDGAERSQGLMHVESMPRNAGMLFVYDHPQTVAFWMKNTLIPLDMIFIDETGTVSRVHQNAIPHDETSIFGGNQIQFVLEINGGLSSIFGIGPGDQIQHPAIDETIAVWPCG